MNAFRGDWQVYPGAGYVVAFSNPQGSTGYGQNFPATRRISNGSANISAANRPHGRPNSFLRNAVFDSQTRKRVER
jgi:hypothetical protein